MRAVKRDIVELFGYSPDDISNNAIDVWSSKLCPFRSQPCTKYNHDKSEVYGVCTVTNGIKKEEGSEVIICPKRLYANFFQSLQDVAKVAWPNMELEFIADGSSVDELYEKATKYDDVVVAFGQGSGNEISVNSPNGKLSMDWVLQRYAKNESGGLVAVDFVGVEVQSIDITGNYRDAWSAYNQYKSSKNTTNIPDSGHGLNWANVHKRLIPQIIRKGNVYAESKNCVGFFFVLPDVVYEKFEEVLGINKDKVDLENMQCSDKSTLSILTYRVGPLVDPGKMRNLIKVRTLHYRLIDIIEAFSLNQYEESSKELDLKLQQIFPNG